MGNRQDSHRVAPAFDSIDQEDWSDMGRPGERAGAEPRGPLQIGGYQLLGLLGSGGMGQVYKARPVVGGEPVALKVIGPALNRPEDRARFDREVRNVQRLDHPGIVPIYASGQSGGRQYYTMEYVDGVTLRHLLDCLAQWAGPGTLDDAVEAALNRHPAAAEPGPPTPDRDEGRGADEAPERPPITPAAEALIRSKEYIGWSCRVVRDAAEALAHAHRAGLAHRDVKPENILLDASGKVRVIDFGVARAFEDTLLTRSGQMLGTPMYMSPEQVLGSRDVDSTTDVYSLGLVLFELLTLAPPIPARNIADLFRRIADHELYSAPSKNPAVPPELDALIHKAAKKDREKRYPTASGLADDLTTWLGKQPLGLPRYKHTPNRRIIRAIRPEQISLIANLFFFAAIGFFWLALSDATLGIGLIAGERFGTPRPRGADFPPGILFREAALYLGGSLAFGWIGLGLYLGRCWLPAYPAMASRIALCRQPAYLAMAVGIAFSIYGLWSNFAVFWFVLANVDLQNEKDLENFKLYILNFYRFTSLLICLTWALVALARAPSDFFDQVHKFHRQED